jgi:hypothetical protein
MSDPDATIGAAYPRLVVAGRWAAGIVLAGLLAALAWLFVLQEGNTGNIFGATWTDHDFPDGLGNTLGAEETARVGLYVTLLMGVVAAGLFAALRHRLPGRGLVKGLIFAPLPFLAWGLLFTPLVDSRQIIDRTTAEYVYLPTGVFGWDAGHGTIISGAVAAIVAGLIMARVLDLAVTPAWWQAHPSAGHGLAEDPAALLELPEQGTQQGIERTS